MGPGFSRPNHFFSFLSVQLNTLKKKISIPFSLQSFSSTLFHPKQTHPSEIQDWKKNTHVKKMNFYILQSQKLS